MATLKQKRVAKALVENLRAEEPLNAGELLESVGYAHSVAIGKPGEILEQKGVLHELANYGFNPETARGVVSEILISGENDAVKLKAADMVFKVHGSYAAEKHINLNLNEAPSERIQEIADRMRKANG